MPLSKYFAMPVAISMYYNEHCEVVLIERLQLLFVEIEKMFNEFKIYSQTDDIITVLEFIHKIDRVYTYLTFDDEREERLFEALAKICLKNSDIIGEKRVEVG